MSLVQSARRVAERLFAATPRQIPEPGLAPFDTEAPLAPMAGTEALTRFEHAVWSSRDDLRRLYDLETRSGRHCFLAWRRRHLGAEYDWPAHRSPVGEGNSEIRPLDAVGIRLIGYARGELGLGENLRCLARAFTLAGLPFEVVDVGARIASRNLAAMPAGETFLQRPLANLFLVNPDLLPRACAQLGRLRLAQARNVAYPFWELGRIPDTWPPVLSLMDEVWVASRHVHAACADENIPPVHVVPLPLALPPPAPLDRHHFGLRDDEYAFLVCFDGLSGIERKNPAAAARAFLQAFPEGDERVRLVIKSMNAADHSQWDILIDCARRDSRIVLMRDTLHAEEFLALVRNCDCIVSTHRAEGLGRIPLEAMAMGKPVILTAHSGVLDYAREDNACLLDFRLVPVPVEEYPHASGQTWAEPDERHAAQWMRRLVAAPDWGRALGEKAADDVMRRYAPTTQVRQILELTSSGPRHRMPV